MHNKEIKKALELISMLDEINSHFAKFEVMHRKDYTYLINKYKK